MGGCWVPIKKQRGQGWGLTLMSCIKALLNYCLWKTYSQCCYLPHGTILVIRPKLANLEERDGQLSCTTAAEWWGSLEKEWENLYPMPVILSPVAHMVPDENGRCWNQGKITVPLLCILSFNPTTCVSPKQFDCSLHLVRHQLRVQVQIPTGCVRTWLKKVASTVSKTCGTWDTLFAKIHLYPGAISIHVTFKWMNNIKDHILWKIHGKYVNFGLAGEKSIKIL